MGFGGKEKALIKKLSELFYQGEELKTSLAVLSDVYGCMASVVYERDGVNRVLCSSELNIDRIEALNHQLTRMRITKEEVLSYDGFYTRFRAYPLNTSVLEGALLLDGEKSIPALPEEIVRILAMHARHEKMSRDLTSAQILDATTGLRNREGLLETLTKEGRAFAYLGCIRLLNRAEILNKLGCHYDTVLSVKCSNEILRHFKRQVYRLSVDTWAVLFAEGFFEDILMERFGDFIDDLSEEIRGSGYYVAFTKIENDPLYSLFLCESSAARAEGRAVVFCESYAEGDLTDLMHTKTVLTAEESQIKDAGKKEGADFYQESEVYNLNRADTAPFPEEEPVKVPEDSYREVDEYGDAVVGPEDSFDYSDAFEDISEPGEDGVSTKEGGEESREKKE